MTTLTINSELNDDWMKALPGYKDEVEITESAKGGKNHKPAKVIKLKKE